jgi:ring-1,2-phenylacetyl-CoA epoxidase subunit PaaE
MPEQPSIYKRIRIKEVHEEVPGFKTIVFTDDHNIQYKSGQYITLVAVVRGEEIRRSYSITSCPDLNEPLTIGVKRKANGFFSRLLVDHAQPRDELITTGSGGLFILPEDIQLNQQLFFFAAGSGITPIYSLLKSALYIHQLPVVLIYSNTSPATTIFLKQIKKLKEEFNDRFQLEFLFSNAPELIKARLHRELLIYLINHFSLDDYSGTLFYICGPYSYMRMITYVLQEVHVPGDNIKKENFLIDQVTPLQIMPPDKQTHEAKIRFAGKIYNVQVQYPDSILRAAKKLGIILPYSCETGRCGNCVAKCKKGNVWLSYNEVLTDSELSKGLTLTCVGHPVGGDVELEIS